MRELRTGDRQLIRDLNMSIVVNAIRQYGPIPRVEIARITRLGRSTVSELTAILLREGFVREIRSPDTDEKKRPLGRRPVLLEFNPRARFAIGVKLAPRKVSAALTDLDADILDSAEVPLGERAADKIVLQQVTRVIRQMMSKAGKNMEKVVGIGVVMPGIVDSRTGVSVSPRFFPWQNLPFKQLLEEEYGVPVFIDNDANAAVLGEKWRGKGRNAENMVCVTIGIGIGGGIIINNQLYHGSTGGGGEIGHITISEDGPQCFCGNAGCLESFASDSAIEREMRKLVRDGVKTLVLDLAGGDVDKITRTMIVQAAREGDAAAIEVLRSAGRHIGIGLANVVSVLNPELVVIAGEAAQEAGDLLIEPIKETLVKRSMYTLARGVEVAASLLGNSIWVIGAATLVLQDFLGTPLYERREPVSAMSLPELMQSRTKVEVTAP